VLAACCVLSLGRVDAGDLAPSGSCPCGREPAAMISAAPLFAPQAVSIAPSGVYIAPLPPIVPPPGTLGVTYQRQSWLIPANRHPRIAVLDVRAPAGATSVRVYTTYQYREEDEIAGFQDLHDPCVWHFETDPLVPGIPHIYRVESQGANCTEVKMVRLSRGRRVTLEF
jgi:hypothetical protein